MVIRFVNSLNDVNPLDYPGDYFAVQKGDEFEIYQAIPGDQLGGFWSSLLGIAAPFANLIPGVGQIASAGLAAASGALKQNEINKQASKDQIIAQFAANMDSVLQALMNGQIASSEAIAMVNDSYKKWSETKFSQPEKDQGYFYKQELAILSPKWEAVKAKAAEVAKIENEIAATAAEEKASEFAFGLTLSEVALAAGAIFLFTR